MNDISLKRWRRFKERRLAVVSSIILFILIFLLTSFITYLQFVDVFRVIML